MCIRDSSNNGSTAYLFEYPFYTTPSVSLNFNGLESTQTSQMIVSRFGVSATFHGSGSTNALTAQFMAVGFGKEYT